MCVSLSERKRAQGISALETCQNIQNCTVDFLTEIRYTKNEEMAEIPSLTISQDLTERRRCQWDKRRKKLLLTCF